jgi:diguanylate cyclase (GGDEF)-like protein/putative nucleotidyltransferase with HDIG domain
MNNTKGKYQLKILCLEESLLNADLIQKYLNENSDYSIQMDMVIKEKEFVAAISTQKYDIILSDFMLLDFNGFVALKHVKSICPSTPFICVSGIIGAGTAVELLKQGATDYVFKDKLGRLIFVIERALKESKENEEKEKLAAELVIANKAKAERAAELVIANKELVFQNEEKEKRAVELVIANKELVFQNGEKEKRAAELVIANEELVFQNEEKEKRAAELVIANKEKVDRAIELVVANKEKADRAAELVIVNKDLVVQNTKNSYLGFHDQLTGLYNRRFYEEELIRLDKKRNFPLTIAMGDVNGLKLVNDSFGHTMGDELLRKVAEAIEKACRADDIIARLGGDEFVIILPKTTRGEAKKVIKRIWDLAAKEKVSSLNISISFGYATKMNERENIQEIFKKAEDRMYKHKVYESSSTRSTTVDLIINTLYEKNNREMLHSNRVSKLCENIAMKMNFDKDDVNKLRTAGLMHDIGKIGISEKILNKPQKLNNEEWTEIKRHPEIGYRILSSVHEFSEIADYVLEHQERWDGKGYPRGLKGEKISIQARIIAVADSFDAMTTHRAYGTILSEKKAIDEIKKCSGKQFDPNIAKIFIERVLEKEWE